MLLLLSSLSFAQDGVDGHNFRMVPSTGETLDLLTTWRPTRYTAGSLGVGGLFEYADASVYSVTEDWNGVTRTAMLDNIMALNLGFAYAPVERLAITVAAPLYLNSVGLTGAQGVGLGDVRLAAPIGLVLPERIGVSLVPYVDAPTGDSAALLGNGGLAFGGLLAAGLHGTRFTADANLGYGQTPAVEFQNITGGGHLLAALGGGLAVNDWLGLRAEGIYRAALQENTVAGSASPGEVILSARGRYEGGLSWTLGGAAGLSNGVGAPAYRAFLGLGWSSAPDPNKDTDQDGLIDTADTCPKEAEASNGWKDTDGCPDGLADWTLKVIDDEGTPIAGATITIDGQSYTTDSEGRIAVSGRMPESTITASVKAANYSEGTLTTAALSEGANPQTYTLPWLPGTVRVLAKHDGKPIDAAVSFMGPSAINPVQLGEDGRALLVLPPGEWTLQVNAAGMLDASQRLNVPASNKLTVAEFTLAPPKAQMTEKAIVVLEPVRFDYNSAALRPDAEAILKEVADILLKNPEILQVEIQGHTDSEGDSAQNLQLSQERVDAVRTWLIANGIDAARLVAKGYGETTPIATNDTEEGRAQNRRVQFVIVERKAQ